MKYLLLTPLLLSACVVHQDPCIGPLPKEYNCVEMDRSDRASFVAHDSAGGNTSSGDNGAGSASFDVNHDSDGSRDSHDSGDSNGDNSDE